MRVAIRWLLVVTIFVFGIRVANARPAQYCYGYQTTDYACGDQGCVATVTWHEACYWWDNGSGGDSTPPQGGDPNGDPYPGSSYGDTNGNGVLDDWSDLVETSDPCAYNVDYGDRLGSDYGGPNDSCCAPAGETGRSGHNGVDIQGNLGDPIHVLKNGYVDRAGDDGTGCGYSIRIRHDDGSSTTYCHMTFGSIPSTFQSVDARVRGGAQIGQVGDTGSPPPGAYHVHVIYLDPQGNHREFFNYSESGPTPDQMNPQGC